MIYIENTTTQQTLAIPRTYEGEGSGALKFSLKSMSDNAIAADNLSVTDEFKNAIVISFAVSLPSGLKNGSYEYTLTRAGVLVSAGVAQVGTYQRVTKAAQSSRIIEFKQYGE